MRSPFNTRIGAILVSAVLTPIGFFTLIYGHVLFLDSALSSMPFGTPFGFTLLIVGSLTMQLQSILIGQNRGYGALTTAASAILIAFCVHAVGCAQPEWIPETIISASILTEASHLPETAASIMVATMIGTYLAHHRVYRVNTAAHYPFAPPRRGPITFFALTFTSTLLFIAGVVALMLSFSSDENLLLYRAAISTTVSFSTLEIIFSTVSCVFFFFGALLYARSSVAPLVSGLLTLLLPAILLALWTMLSGSVATLGAPDTVIFAVAYPTLSALGITVISNAHGPYWARHPDTDAAEDEAVKEIPAPMPATPGKL